MDKERKKSILSSFKYPAKVHVWGGISILGTKLLRIFTENFNQQAYIDTLDECLVSQANALYGNEWYLQEDNSLVHTGKASQAWKSEFVPSRIDWLPNSPDLAPIENLWCVMKSRFIVRNPKTVSKLREVIQEI